MSTIEAKEYDNINKKIWKCVVCGEEFIGVNPPDICPACGAVADQFIEVSESKVTFNSDKKEKFLIIGNGAAGYYAAGAIRKRNTECEIEIISEEPYLTYYRPSISDAIGKEINMDSFYLSPNEWYTDNNITLTLGVVVQSLKPNEKQVLLNDGTSIRYDKLILANGSKNFMPPVVGADKSGVFSLRDIKDLELINSKLKTSKNVVIVGGGLLGLEAAYEIIKTGIHVSVIEFNSSLLNRQLDSESSLILQAAVESHNIEVILGDSVITLNGDTCVESASLKSGKVIDADLVLFSTGISPNISIADNTDIVTNRGILINSYMETNIKDIYACGDIAEFNGRVYGNWASAVQMGKATGTNVVGHKQEFIPTLGVISFNAMGLTLLSVGEISNELSKTIILNDTENKIYKKFFFINDLIVGGILIGDTKSSAKLIMAIKGSKPMKTVLEDGLI